MGKGVPTGLGEVIRPGGTVGANSSTGEGVGWLMGGGLGFTLFGFLT